MVEGAALGVGTPTLCVWSGSECMSPACHTEGRKSMDFRELLEQETHRPQHCHVKIVGTRKAVFRQRHLILQHTELVPVCGRVTWIFWNEGFNPG